MKPSGGAWLFLTGAVYIELLVMNVIAGTPVPSEFIQMGWVLIMSLPLYVPPLARFFNVKCIWEA